MSTLTTHNNATLTTASATALAGTELKNITIKKVVGMVPVAAMLPGPGTIFGLISFRGKTVPVIDLRLHNLAMFPLPADEQICILAAETGQHVPILFGALVDSEAAAHELVMGTTH